MNRGGKREGSGRPKKDIPRRTTISFVCTADEKELIDKHCESQNVSRSNFILNAIKKYISGISE
jgi:uncharacterized protein (DUF1778 family)